MAQFIRTKKLTDTGYSPTLAISEPTRRAELDGSIQEISDILYSTANGKGASQVGLENNPYATVQLLADGIKGAAVGFVPLDASVTNAKLATDVKVGSLATLLTTSKISVVGAINEMLTQTVTTITSGFASGWSGDITVLKGLGNWCETYLFVTSTSDIVIGTIHTLPVGLRPKVNSSISCVIYTTTGSIVSTASAEVTIDTSGGISIYNAGTSTNARQLRRIKFGYYSA